MCTQYCFTNKTIFYKFDETSAVFISIFSTSNFVPFQSKLCSGETLSGVKRQQGFTTGAAFCVYNVLSFIFEMVHHSHGSSWSKEKEGLMLLFCSFECSNCWQLGSGGLRQKVLFRASWNLFFVCTWLIRGLGTQGESKISSFCFSCGSRER